MDNSSPKCGSFLFWLAIEILTFAIYFQRRIFFFHETAVTAYFKFIALSADGSEDKVVAATLRLLQLTVRHALELQESILTGLATTPCGKWRPIIPQLFSRLLF